MNSDILNILILLGAVQGFIVCAMLFASKKNNRLANRMLGFLILLLALACFNLALQNSDLYGKFPDLHWIPDLLPLVVAMPFGPLLYFYTRSVVDPSFSLERRHKLQFLTIAVDIVPTAAVWIFLGGYFLGLIGKSDGPAWGNFIDEYNAYADIPRWMATTIYAWLAFRTLKLSRTDKNEFGWLHKFLVFFLAFLALWFVFLVPYIIPSLRYPLLDAVGWYPIYIPIAVIVYWLGIRGYLYAQTAHERKNGTTAPAAEAIAPTVESLKRAMAVERKYRDPQLTVKGLADYLGIPQKTISWVLNQHLHQSFSEFVNTYRVDEVKARLLENSATHLTIAGIAFEAGFNSQATFQRAFRQQCGVSPSKFLSDVLPATLK